MNNPRQERHVRCIHAASPTEEPPPKKDLRSSDEAPSIHGMHRGHLYPLSGRKPTCTPVVAVAADTNAHQTNCATLNGTLNHGKAKGCAKDVYKGTAMCITRSGLYSWDNFYVKSSAGYTGPAINYDACFSSATNSYPKWKLCHQQVIGDVCTEWLPYLG